MTAIARLKREAADRNLLHILKRKRAETDLAREEALLENANQRIADEIDTLENDYQREQAELAQKHAAQQQRALEAIERKKPEFYREKTLKDRPVPRRHARDPKHPRESGYER
jgi:alpha-L-fucosidase